MPRYLALFHSLACRLRRRLFGAARHRHRRQRRSAAAPSAAPAAPAAPVHDGRAIEITANDTMKFSVTEIAAKPGEKLSVTLVNIGTTPKFSMGHNWVLLAADVDIQPFLVAAAEAVTTDYVPAATQKDQDPRRHEAPRPEGARHRHVHGADHAGPLRVPLFVPRALPGRHAWRADRRLTCIQKDFAMSTRFTLLARRQPRCRPAGHRGLQPSGKPHRRRQRHLRRGEVLSSPPGEKDEFYLFYSGGHSGQVYVAGLPSMRHISTIPVFAPYPATGYGFDEESKQMMGRFTWGDVHHPGLSQSDGKYDGRWLFVNDNANNRIARIDLRDFKTQADPRADPELERQSRLVVRDREQRVRPRRLALLGAAAEGPLRRSVDLQDRVQRHGERHQDRSEDRRDGGRLADPDAAVQLGPRIDRQGTELGLGVLDVLQLRDGARDARGHVDAGRARLRGRRQLARSRAGGQGRQGDA